MRKREIQKSKIVILKKKFPIYKEYSFMSLPNTDEVIGYTTPGDQAVITYCEDDQNYAEFVIITGKHNGYDNLALYPADYKYLETWKKK